MRNLLVGCNPKSDSLKRSEVYVFMRTLFQRKLFLLVVTVGFAVATSAAWAGGSKETSTAMASGTSGGKISILETGSTLLYPLFNIWVPDYTGSHPNVQITTQGTGSGTGIAMASNGTAQIGASDAYMSDALLAQHPGVLNIPLAISAQQINYNLPGLNDKHLRLSGPVLAGIYSGKITNWDDAAIAALNPGVTFPNKAIIPVHRTDGSGDTFIFTQYLSDSTPAWNSSVGSGVSVSWPAVQGGIGAEGNPGMVQALQQNPYAIAYVGVSWLDQTNKAGLGEAKIENKDGNFLMPTPETIGAAAQAGFKGTPADERISLIFEPGANSYPIINYEYALVATKQPSAAMANALKAFLTWALDPNGGESASYLDKVHFQPLPASIIKLSQTQIDKIGS